MNYTETDLTGVLQAVKFAAEKHRDQRRKNAEAWPYINHPIEVAELLWTVGQVRDVKIIQAAILHDTLEDTDTTREDLETLFGREVLEMVGEVTDDKSMPKAQRKQLQIEHAPHLSPGAKQIKLADKISNVQALTSFPPADWTSQRIREYVAWAREVVCGLRGCNKSLEAQFDETAKRFEFETD
jgi:guanosine-3',5'-bis(diphosphate) 3'-pyrophosphohydrolase